MYKIAEDINLNSLKNLIISQISFGLNYILLSMDDSSIQFSGPFLYKYNGMQFERDEVYPVNSDFGLLNLLEKEIEDIYCNDERTSLTIHFGDDFILCLKSNEMYESFEMNIDGKRVIV
jgi:hypothetical protein